MFDSKFVFPDIMFTYLWTAVFLLIISMVIVSLKGGVNYNRLSIFSLVVVIESGDKVYENDLEVNEFDTQDEDNSIQDEDNSPTANPPSG